MIFQRPFFSHLVLTLTLNSMRLTVTFLLVCSKKKNHFNRNPIALSLQGPSYISLANCEDIRGKGIPACLIRYVVLRKTQGRFSLCPDVPSQATALRFSPPPHHKITPSVRDLIKCRVYSIDFLSHQYVWGRDQINKSPLKQQTKYLSLGVWGKTHSGSHSRLKNRQRKARWQDVPWKQSITIGFVEECRGVCAHNKIV